jgi:hypothetical protein
MPKQSPKWPDELRSPIVLDELVVPLGLFALGDQTAIGSYKEKLQEEKLSALVGRLNVLGEFLGLFRNPEITGRVDVASNRPLQPLGNPRLSDSSVKASWTGRFQDMDRSQAMRTFR